MIDDGFKDWSGHNAAYALSILDELIARGIDCELFVNRAVIPMAARESQIRRAFRIFAAGFSLEWRFAPVFIQRLLRIAFANWSHLRDLLESVSPHIRLGDTVVVLIASSRTTLAYALWLRWLSLSKIPVDAVFIVHNSPHSFFKWETRLLAAAAGKCRVHWAAHTEHVRGRCADLAGGDAFLLPLPFGALSSPEGCRDRNYGSSLLFSYLGVAGFTKGLDLLADAIEQIQDLLIARRLRLAIQCNVHMKNEPLEQLARRLARLASQVPGIEGIPGALTPAEYRRRLSESDLLLHPHRRRYYQFALSGIFTEALSMGKPVILAAGTYMEEELQRFGGGLSFQDGDAAAFANVIRKAVEDIDSLRSRSAAAQPVWRNTHNAAQYVDKLHALVGGV